MGAFTGSLFCGVWLAEPKLRCVDDRADLEIGDAVGGHVGRIGGRVGGRVAAVAAGRAAVAASWCWSVRSWGQRVADPGFLLSGRCVVARAIEGSSGQGAGESSCVAFVVAVVGCVMLGRWSRFSCRVVGEARHGGS